MDLHTPYRKAIVIGIDGLDPGLCRTMMSQGRLPHLRALASQGTFVALQTSNPAQSPVAWTCLATGSNPGGHGIYDFIVRDPGSYLPRLSLTRPGSGETATPAYATPTFFEVAAKAGLPTTAVRWPVTYPPAFPQTRMLAGLGAPDVKGRLGNYVQFTEKAENSGGRGRFEPVFFSGEQAQVLVEGPITIVSGQRTPAKIPLDLIRRKGRLEYSISQQRGQLEPGCWSPYLSLLFTSNGGRQVRAITRIFLNKLTPLELYLGPLQIDPRDATLPIATPPDYATELVTALGGPFSTLGMPEETKGLTDGVVTDEAFLSFCEDVTREREAMLAYELHRFRDGLLSVVFDTSDRIQHCFWRLHDPSHPLYDPAVAKRLGPVIEDHMSRMDAMVGSVMEAAGSDTALFVCSDHGFCSYTRSVNLNAWLARAGYLSLRSHDPNDAGELFKHVDWSSTRAYALGFGSIYLNLSGRERLGQVAPGADARDLAEEIATRLESLDDVGTPVVGAVHRSNRLYHGSQTPAAPDLVVGLRPPYRVAWPSAIGGTAPDIFADNRQKWSGDHCVDAAFVPGSLFSNLRLTVGKLPVPQTRLAATVCRRLGLTPAATMEPELSTMG